MRRSFIGLVMLAFAFALAVPASFAAAQIATPQAPPAETAPSAPVGETVSYISESGSEIATLTVVQMVRPWNEFDEFYEPKAGTEYIAFEIEITHLGRRGDLVAQTYDFRLQDRDGFLLSPAWVDAADQADLSPTSDEIDLAPEETGSIVVAFQVIEDIELSHLFWLPEYDRMITLYDFDAS